VAHYAIASLAKYRVSVSMKNDLLQRKVCASNCLTVVQCW